MAKPLVSASYDKSRFLVMHDPDAHPLESLARGKSREIQEIQCQFIILARKDELTPDFEQVKLTGGPDWLDRTETLECGEWTDFIVCLRGWRGGRK
jgi:hypothetical protein